ncbi:MAG: hypothetical protein ACRC3A_07680 [Culicoidibacterales bacterium]
MDYQTFCSTMNLAVMQGIESYDSYANAKLQTYLQVCVRNQLLTVSTGQKKKIKTVHLEPEVLEIAQHQQMPNKILGEVCFEVEYKDFVESLTDEQQNVFQAKLAGKPSRLIAEENEISRSKVRQIEEKLKTKAKIYGLIEKER